MKHKQAKMPKGMKGSNKPGKSERGFRPASAKKVESVGGSKTREKRLEGRGL